VPPALVRVAACSPGDDRRLLGRRLLLLLLLLLSRACRAHTTAYVRSEWLERDYGEPLGVCSETSPGVFSREWTRARVEHNCHTGLSTLHLAGIDYQEEY
jgi:hypothetical protein